jgi:hypothetical protein
MISEIHVLLYFNESDWISRIPPKKNHVKKIQFQINSNLLAYQTKKKNIKRKNEEISKELSIDKKG